VTGISIISLHLILCLWRAYCLTIDSVYINMLDITSEFRIVSIFVIIYILEIFLTQYLGCSLSVYLISYVCFLWLLDSLDNLQHSTQPNPESWSHTLSSSYENSGTNTYCVEAAVWIVVVKCLPVLFLLYWSNWKLQKNFALPPWILLILQNNYLNESCTFTTHHFTSSREVSYLSFQILQSAQSPITLLRIVEN
jgi:hypothetical protein